MSEAPLTVDVHLTPADLRDALKDDVATGLRHRPRSIPPLWFYDERGSRLFEEITRLPEYYPTRAERRLLAEAAGRIAAIARADTLVELGAGACDKTRLLLQAMHAQAPLRRYVPLDVSEEFLRAAAAGLVAEFGALEVHAVIGDFQRHLDRIPFGGRRLIAFLGGTIGNLVPAQRARFLFDLNCTMAGTDHLLLGADLLKDPERILRAYDDAAGITAAFNRNVLHVINRELGASFDVERFEHIARWDDQQHWIEMRLRSTVDQTVIIEDLGMEIRFAEGEEILTEISAKFTFEQLQSELEAAGFVVDETWGAAEGEFLLTLAHPYC